MSSNGPDDIEKNANTQRRSNEHQDAVGSRVVKSKKRLLESPCGESAQAVSYITIAVAGLLIWALLFALFEREAEPGGQLFQLMVLTFASAFCGWLVSLVEVPSLLGMLLCGIALKNFGIFQISGIYLEIASTIRKVALALNLLKAGLRLDAKALKKLSVVVTRLSVIPFVTETAGAAVTAYYLLGLPWMWGLLLGSVLSAVSPSVVVPMLQNLQRKGYGEDKGISTLVIAASSIDDIIAIVMFGVTLGIVFVGGDLTHNLLQGPIEIALGVVLGIGGGILAACVPHRDENSLAAKRSFIVIGGGLVVILLSPLYGFSGAGPLATIILAFIAQLCWQWQGWSNTYNPVADVVDILWSIVEPMLFGLIGTEIRINQVKLELLGFGMSVLAFSSITRSLGCCVALIGANLNLKEILFVNIAWLPKATVQATLGPMALEWALRSGIISVQSYAENLLTISVLSILVTAPLGAIGIAMGGPRLLHKEPEKEKPNRMVDRTSDVAIFEDHRL